MKKIIIIFLAVTLALGGCVREDTSDCGAEMTLSFNLDNRYEQGSFDTKIAGDVRLYVFKDGKCIDVIDIPYSQIRGDGKYVVQKTPEMDGELQFVAFAVSAVEGTATSAPSLKKGDSIDDLYMELSPATGTDYYSAADCGLYMGTLTVDERANQPSEHTIGLYHGVCRVEVHVSDNGDRMLGTEGSVRANGTMTRMNYAGEGSGQEAVIYRPLNITPRSGTYYTTGRFGVMPSGANQLVSIDVYSDDALLATLTVPRESLPMGARAGGLLIFDYVMGAAEFHLTIEDYTVKIAIIDHI